MDLHHDRLMYESFIQFCILLTCFTFLLIDKSHNKYSTQRVELAWRSGSVMDCQATARGSIPGGIGLKTELHVLRKGQ